MSQSHHQSSSEALSEKQVRDSIQSSSAEKIKIAITDIDGVMRGKFVSKEKFLSAMESGFGFCNVVFGWDINDLVYENCKYTGWHTGYPDAQARIDLKTFREIPWENKVPFFIADFINDKGQGLEVCPRQLLKKVIQKAKDMGFEAFFSLEYEFFNFQETPQSWADKGFQNPSPLTPGMFGYSLLRSSLNQDYFNALMDDCRAFKIPIEGLHTETGPGVYEAAIHYGEALEAADRAVLFKTAAKQIAYRYQIMPSFMAKWNSKLPGCGGHMHQSLWKNGKNVFYDAQKPHKMSDTFRHYLAGQMACSPDLLSLYAPNINSYKRLVEGHWAPTKVTWSADNRTSSFRVISGGEKSTRMETRVAGADVNPYLAIAAALASGLYGIEKKMALPDSVQGNAYRAEKVTRYAKNLSTATDQLEKSEIAGELLGREFVDHYVRTRRWEWDRFEQSVSSWEMERYFELV